jgi:hypothetical protein
MSRTFTSQWFKKQCSWIDSRINHKIPDVLRIVSQAATMCSRRYQRSTMRVNISEVLNISANGNVDASFESRLNSTYPTSKVGIVRLLGSSEADENSYYVWSSYYVRSSGVPRGVVWGFNPHPKFRNFDKVPKIKKILLYEMKFIVPNYSCLQNPWLRGGGTATRSPFSLSSVLNWICWTPPPPNKILGYATGQIVSGITT